ncbi:hypothetical protein CY34DRAFT_813179 [Suillus luteus UH-Slu-Lm8-n1]|uniref:Uncharacterized protein n=1 Tax=Suillus luteus UH-Slu-Lm8-n1 TaxID=930992 RepID=A0A0D0A7D2_9AGAM|nr:hypothetical protein CY34DRAFT_813179 [Suillus luteus UH-Slu-Lm8-n1]
MGKITTVSQYHILEKRILKVENLLLGDPIFSDSYVSEQHEGYTGEGLTTRASKPALIRPGCVTRSLALDAQGFAKVSTF